MFSNIPDLLSVVLVATVFVTALIGVVQYSRYEAHRKAHIKDPESSDSFRLATKFSVVPYLIVPIMFGAVGIFSSLILTDIVAGRGYVSGIETGYFGTALSVVLYMIMDKLVVRHCGDQVYFDTVEDKLFQSTVDTLQPVGGTSGSITLSMQQYADLINKRK